MAHQDDKSRRQAEEPRYGGDQCKPKPPQPQGLCQVPIGQHKAADPRNAHRDQRRRGHQPRIHRRRTNHNATDGGDGLTNGLGQMNAGLLQQLKGQQ